MIADAIRADIVPVKYYTDAEILLTTPEEQEFAIFERFVAQKNLLEKVGTFLQEHNVSTHSAPLQGVL